MTTAHRWLVCIAVFIIVPLSGMATDIYVPSLPAIKQYFQTSVALSQLSVSVFLLTLGFFQLIAGPLSEHFGRKSMLISGCILFIISSYCAASAETITFFLWMRFFQGIAISLTATTVRTIFTEIYSGVQYYKMMNYSTMAWSIGPILSPALGGFLQTHFGWHANFYFLTMYTCLALICCCIMPETIDKKTRFNLILAITNYKTILKNTQFICTFLIVSLSYTVVTIFYIVGPFLIQTELGHTPLFYGALALVLGIAWLSGNTANRLSANVDPMLKIKTGILAGLFISSFMVITNYLIPLNIWAIMCPTFFMVMAGGLTFPNAYAICMRLFPHLAGYASAAMGSSLFACASLIAAAASLLGTKDSLPFALSYFSISIALLLICFIGLKQSPEKKHDGS